MIGNRIKQVRKSANETQSQMGERLGVAQRTIASWECEQRHPSLDLLIAISKTYGVTTDYLLGLANSPSVPAQQEKGAQQIMPRPDETFIVESGCSRFVEEMPQTPEELQELVRKYVDQRLAEGK